MRTPFARLASAIAVLSVLAISRPARAVGFDANDFIVVSSNFGSGVQVYSETFALKGNLPVNATVSSGISGDRVGRVVVRNQSSPSLQLFNNAGGNVSDVNAFQNLSGDVKVSEAGNYLVATSDAMKSVQEFSPGGALLRTLGSKAYRSAAVLPGNILWAGLGNSNTVDVFDLTTGLLTSSFALTGGQNVASSMYYSYTTNTVLITDTLPSGVLTTANIVYERDLSGALIRAFTPPVTLGPGPIDPDLILTSAGVTRGPGGDVYATDYVMHRVAQWQADGTFVGFKPAGNNPWGIIWTGAIPEPGSAMLGGLATMGLVALGRRLR